jgi:cell division protease FtsH
VIVIAVTHDRSLLDPAVLRPGRLDTHVRTELPDAEARRVMLRAYFGRLHSRAAAGAGRAAAEGAPIAASGEADATASALDSVPQASGTVTPRLPSVWPSVESRLVDCTAGWSHADVSALWQEAAMLALRRVMTCAAAAATRNHGKEGSEGRASIDRLGDEDWEVTEADIDGALATVAAHAAVTA